mmetsp:Transcript_47408/g.71781  ORF Transcript_47408/g.71781 Transcript_47408/m.71781 type:complete len:542 (+) Transcript_47408:80-1705(+)
MKMGSSLSSSVVAYGIAIIAISTSTIHGLESKRYASLARSNMAFAVPPSRRQQQVHSSSFSPSSLCMSAEVVPPGTTSNVKTSDDDGKTWWKEYKFKDADFFEKVRQEFPILSIKVGGDGSNDGAEEEESMKELIYLDSAATSHKPLYVTDALTSYYNKINSNVHRGAHSLSRLATSKYEKARDSIAKFVNAYSRNEIVFTSGATESLNLVASSYARSKLTKGDEIIITEMEHHSNIVPWQIVAQQTGATLKYVPLNVETGEFDIETLDSLVTSNTKIVSFQHVSNVLGTINPVSDIVTLVRSKASPDCKIVLDACQSVPHMPVNVQELGVDFLAASGHKMCGPTGIGFLWAHENTLNDMPPYMGGGEMIDDVEMEKSTYAPSPARFEAGTPAIAQSIGLGAAVDYLMNIGMDRIHAYEKELAYYLRRRLCEVDGVKVLGPNEDVPTAALVSFVCDYVHASDLSTFLDMEGVAVRAGHHCCQPLHKAVGHSHSARASLYIYNNKEDIDKFIEHLQDTLSFFGSLEGDNDGDGSDEEFVPFI